jgi:hypothetical protein
MRLDQIFFSRFEEADGPVKERLMPLVEWLQDADSEDEESD